MVRAKKERLSRRAWVAAAVRALERGGVAAVRVEVLARTLAVTKGSFYWHFEDRRALLDAMLERWREVATEAVIDAVEAEGGDPAARLWTLVALTSDGEGERLEAAVRAWAMTDEAARAVVARVDARREGYVTELLVAHGIAAEEARHLARVLYLAMIGEFTWVAQGGAPSPKGVWQSLVRRLLDAPPDAPR